MKYVLPLLIIAALMVLVGINAGGGRDAMKVGWSIIIVMGGVGSFWGAVYAALRSTEPTYPCHATTGMRARTARSILA